MTLATLPPTLDFVPKIEFNPLVFFLALLATWTQRGQQRLIDCLVAENRFLRKRFGKKRVPMNDAYRAILGRAWQSYRKEVA